MRRTLTSYFLIGTLAIGTSAAQADEPASGMSRWLKNPFAKEAKDTKESKADAAAQTSESAGRVPPVETTTTKTPTSKWQMPKSASARPQPVRGADATREAPRAAQPVSAPRRATAGAARDAAPPTGTEDAASATTVQPSARGGSPTKPPGLGLGLGKRQPSARAARGSLLDDDAPETETESTPTGATASASAPADPPRRRFIPLSRGHVASRPQPAVDDERVTSPLAQSAASPPTPPEEADAEVPVPRIRSSAIDRVPDPARVAPEEELDEVRVPAPVEQAEEAPKAPSRAPKNSRRGATKKSTEPVPELQVDPGELNEVQILEAEPSAEDEEPAPPKASAKPRTVEADAPADRPSLSQRFKGWLGVKK